MRLRVDLTWMWPMSGWCIVTLASARLKASVRFPPLRGMYQRGGTCKGCDIDGILDQDFGAIPKSEDLVGMGPHAFTKIDNLVEIHITHKAKSTGEV